VITAVDTNILLDVFESDPSFGPSSSDALRRCNREGSLIACEVVWAEVAGVYDEIARLQAAMMRLGIVFSPIDLGASVLAGRSWNVYRNRGGGRGRMIADFLIGAHARTEADRLLTRDRGFYRTYFSDLSIVDPGRA
jgi:predicted nucleic acid-binding protein